MPTADEAPSSPFLLTFDFTQDVQGCLSREHNADSARVHMQDSLLFNALSEVQSMHRPVRSKHSTPKEGRQQESSQRRCVSPTEEKLGRICLVHLPGLLMRTKGNKLLGPHGRHSTTPAFSIH